MICIDSFGWMERFLEGPRATGFNRVMDAVPPGEIVDLRGDGIRGLPEDQTGHGRGGRARGRCGAPSHPVDTGRRSGSPWRRPITAYPWGSIFPMR